MRHKLAAAWISLLLVSGCSPASQTSRAPGTGSIRAAPSQTPPVEALRTGTPAGIAAPGAGDTATPALPLEGTVTPAGQPAEPPGSGELVLAETIAYDPWTLVHDLAWSPDGAWLAAAAGENVFLYAGETLEEVHILDIGAWAKEILFIESERLPGWLLGLAVHDGTLQFWEVQSAALRVKFRAHSRSANSLAVSPDGRWIASSGNDAILRLWEQSAIWGQEVEAISPAAEMIGGAFAVPAVRFSPDGGLVASIDLQAVRLRDPATARLVRTLASDESLFDIAFSPDGRYLAAARTGSSIQLWQVDTGETFATWETEEAEGAFLWSLAFSGDGSRLCAVSSQGGVYLWSFPEGERLAEAKAHAKAASAAAFSPDGERLATGGLDAKVYLWKVAPEGQAAGGD